MYEKFFHHFGLQRNPFHVSPDPQFFFSTPAHDAAVAQLIYGIETRHGVMLLTGEPGTGKTTVIQYLLDWLRQHQYSSSYVFHSLLPSADLLEFILRDFGISCASRSKSELLEGLHGWLLKRHEMGDCPVIIVDEAQALSTRALEQLGLLLNLEVPGGKLVQLVLAGQPLLEEKLRRPELEQLRQRVMFHCRIKALSPEQTGSYIASRLTDAGAGDSSAFPQETMDAVHAHSGGVPRIVNMLCEHALIGAYLDQRKTVSIEDIRKVALHFELIEESERTSVDPVPANGYAYGRLVPVPRLDVPSPAPKLPSYERELLSLLAPEPGKPLPPHVAIAPLQRPGPPVPSPASRSWVMARPRATTGNPSAAPLVRYLWSVGGSLVKDCRLLYNAVHTWLKAPSPRPQGEKMQSQPQAPSRQMPGKPRTWSSRWWRQPMGSPRISANGPRPSTAAQKHF